MFPQDFKGIENDLMEVHREGMHKKSVHCSLLFKNKIQTKQGVVINFVLYITRNKVQSVEFLYFYPKLKLLCQCKYFPHQNAYNNIQIANLQIHS